MNINHRVTPTASVLPYTSQCRKPQNQQKPTKKKVTNPVPFLNFFQQWFKPEKKGEIQNGK